MPRVPSSFFSLSPDPLLRTLPRLRASYNPPPPGRGRCERTIDLRLRAGRRFACFLSFRVALSLALVRYCLACGSGFHHWLSLLPLPVIGSRSLASCPVPRPRFAPCSLSRAFPVSFLLSPHLIRRVRSPLRPLLACPLLGNSVAMSRHLINAVLCFASSASAFRFSSPLRLVLSARFVSCLVPPCLVVPSPRASPCLLRPSRYAVPSRRSWWSSLAIRFSPRLLVSPGRGDRCRIVLAACLLARAFVCGDSVLPVIVRLYRSVMLYI